MNYSSIIVLLGLSALIGSTWALPRDLDEFSEIHQKIFGLNSEAVDPAATLQLLKRLAALGIDDNNMMENGDSDEDVPLKDMKLIKEMIEASEVKNDKCNLNTFVGFNILIKQNLKTPTNAVPYLESCKSKQFMTCKDAFITRLERAVNRLTDDQKTKITTLMDSIKIHSGQENAGGNDKCAHITSQKLDKAIVEFLRATVNTNDEQSIQKEWRNHPEARKEILALCGQVTRQLDETVDIFNELIGTQALTDQVDKKVTDWIFTCNVCRHIIQEVQNIGAQAKDSPLNCPRYCPCYYPGHYQPGGRGYGPGCGCRGGGGYGPGCGCRGGGGYGPGCGGGGGGYGPGCGCHGGSSSCYPGYCPGRCGCGGHGKGGKKE